MHGSSPPPPRLRDMVAKPRSTPVRTLVLVALVPLVAVTIFVIATHRSSSTSATPAASAPPSRSSGVIFVVPVGAPSASPAKSGE